MPRNWKECVDCPEILKEEYGKGANKCAECIVEDKEEKANSKDKEVQDG